MVRADFLLHSASEILTCAGPAPRCGRGQGDVAAIRDAAIASARGRIVFVGRTAECGTAVELAADATVVDAAGGAVIPGFVDAHTHLVYAGNRMHELPARLGGASYAEIAAAGGGILSTVAATRQATEDALVEQSGVRLREMLRCGTTTCEIKSGYGLTTSDELKMLRAVRRLAATEPVKIAATFMGAHEVPPEYRADRAAYVDLLCDGMTAAVAAGSLAEWVDVFCETGVFTVEESKRILLAGRAAGLKLRIHADELASSGGARLASEIGCRSADHLVFVTREDARAMAGAQVTATLLPATALFLRLGRFAPARMLIEEGVPVAIATDVNPGGGLSPSMPFALTLACFQMGMTFEEALVAATINGAWSLDRHADVGSLEVGKRMDAVVVDGEAANLLRVGAPVIRHVIADARLIA